MKVTVDKDACTACGLCIETSPEVYETGEDDIAKVKADPVPPDHEESAKQAAEDCPAEAIKVEA